MTRIDLLPGRYHRLRALMQQLHWVLVAFAALTVILGTVLVAMKAQTKAYVRMSAALSPTAGQYRTINTRFDELQKAEGILRQRKAKAAPLLDQEGSIVPGVRDFTGGLPSGTRLLSLAVDRDGRVALKAESKSYQDVSRFVKWVGETLRYEQVALENVARQADKLVRFDLSAVRPGGGEGQ